MTCSSASWAGLPELRDYHAIFRVLDHTQTEEIEQVYGELARRFSLQQVPTTRAMGPNKPLVVPRLSAAKRIRVLCHLWSF